MFKGFGVISMMLAKRLTKNSKKNVNSNNRNVSTMKRHWNRKNMTRRPRPHKNWNGSNDMRNSRGSASRTVAEVVAGVVVKERREEEGEAKREKI